MAKKATNQNSPWRQEKVTKRSRGGKYDTPDQEKLRRGETRRSIEDKQLERELNDDPLFKSGLK